jgi:hypothetical protein
MGSVHARGDTFLTFGLKALTETNTSRLATGLYHSHLDNAYIFIISDHHQMTGPLALVTFQVM